MANIRIVTDSATDMPQSVKDRYPEVIIIPLTVVTDDGRLLDDEVEITSKEVCDAVREGKVYKTTQVIPDRFREVFEECVKRGESVIYVGFSSGLSGTVQSGRVGAELVKEEYPDADITVIDTLCASFGFGMVVMRAAELVRKGLPKEKVVEGIEFYAQHQEHVFSVDKLLYLRRGGRISGFSAFVGDTLNIKPVMDMEDGKLIPRYKERGHKRAMQRIVEMVRQKSLNSDISHQIIGINHSDCYEFVTELEQMLTEQLGVQQYIESVIGSVISCHTGPGTISMYFVNAWPEDPELIVLKGE
ncbi:MAG: DegV family protein [Firmicutes bacterium]|nr:DegV family protein [Bacillota bacterium]